MSDRTPRLFGWRRLAAALWPAPNDPQMLGDLEVDASAMLAFIDEERRRTGVHVTVLHLVGKALAHALTEHPELNVRPRRDRIVPRHGVDITFIVALDGGDANIGVTIEDAGTKPVAEIARELTARADRARSHGDPALLHAGRLIDRLPFWTLRPLLRLGVWLSVDRGIDLERVGIREGGFGSAIVTSLGGVGIDHSYPMLTPFSRVPVALMVGRVADRPVAVDGLVVVRPTVTLSASLDHRYLDGSHAARLAAAIRAFLADPSASTELRSPAEPASVTGDGAP